MLRVLRGSEAHSQRTWRNSWSGIDQPCQESGAVMLWRGIKADQFSKLTAMQGMTKSVGRELYMPLVGRMQEVSFLK